MGYKNTKSSCLSCMSGEVVQIVEKSEIITKKTFLNIYVTVMRFCLYISSYSSTRLLYF